MSTLTWYRLGSAVARRLPPGVAYPMLAGIAPVVARVAPARRAVIANLRRVRPDAAETELRRMAASVFRTALFNYYDLLRFPARSRSELQASIHVVGLEPVIAAARQLGGAIIAQAHQGGFDVALHEAQVADVPRAVIVEPLEPPEVFRFIAALRAATGVAMLPSTPAGLRSVFALLKHGGIVGIAIDRDVQRNGRLVRFFGEATRLPTGAAVLAVRCNVPVFPAICRRTGGAGVHAEVWEPLLPRTDLPRAEAEVELFERLVAQLERIVLAAPDQWVVFEPVWPGGYPVGSPASAVPLSR